MTDSAHMFHALALAERGRGRTSPNPLVGAVLVDRDGVIVGRGAHEYVGGPHAEINAIRDAAGQARGATLYCTLEPCSHVGRTGPCAESVVEAGIASAVIAVKDPNPLVNGAGLAYLRARGLGVTLGVLRDQAEDLNRPFFSVIRRGRPFVTLKVAVSRDGRIAAAPGVRTPLTGAAANRLIHRDRAEVDAIAVGSGTVLADDPLLTARGAFRHRPLTRVVFDARLRTPPSAKLLSTVGAGPVIIIATSSSVQSEGVRAAALQAAGAELLAVPEGLSLREALELLPARGVSSITVEGGAALHRAFWDAALVDRVQIFRTPHVLGPQGLEWPLAFIFPAGLAGATTLVLGDDLLIEGYGHRAD
ncbi:MAG: bifunctional diaminohydroxyphosphoribosylaminopyrimidine deaminase/5-amino-6-(5-phosphoribosylamino)uracil reductase RibD [Acidobacteriota bacterium]